MEDDHDGPDIRGDARRVTGYIEGVRRPNLPPTPERLRAAGFSSRRGGDQIYGSGGVQLVVDDDNEWYLLSRITKGSQVQSQMLDLPTLPTMTAVRAWMRAVDAANAGGGRGK